MILMLSVVGSVFCSFGNCVLIVLMVVIMFVFGWCCMFRMIVGFVFIYVLSLVFFELVMIVVMLVSIIGWLFLYVMIVLLYWLVFVSWLFVLIVYVCVGLLKLFFGVLMFRFEIVVCRLLRFILYCVSVVGFVWICMVGWLLFDRLMRLMLVICEIFIVRCVLVRFCICVSGSVLDLMVSVSIGVLVGFIFV